MNISGSKTIKPKKEGKQMLHLLQKLKRRIWNKHILLWWYKLWIRKDEFHKSLNMDPHAVMEMDVEERKRYFHDLNRRRSIAHELDLQRDGCNDYFNSFRLGK